MLSSLTESGVLIGLCLLGKQPFLLLSPFLRTAETSEGKEVTIFEGEYKMAKNERFEKIYSQGKLTVTQIWVDKETGVQYLYHIDGYSGGLTQLLDREGKPNKKKNDNGGLTD